MSSRNDGEMMHVFFRISWVLNGFNHWISWPGLCSKSTQAAGQCDVSASGWISLNMYNEHVPSGNLLHRYWKWWFIVDLPTNSMVIFHSYVNLYQRVHCNPCTISMMISMVFPWVFLDFHLAHEGVFVVSGSGLPPICDFPHRRWTATVSRPDFS